MQGGQLRKLSAVQYRLKIIMITLNNSRDENEQKWLISSVWKKWDKRLGRCSATLMVGYLCCKSYYVCALVCIFAIFSCFFLHPRIWYYWCLFFFLFPPAFRRLSFDCFIALPTTHNHSFGFNAAGFEFWIWFST